MIRCHSNGKCVNSSSECESSCVVCPVSIVTKEKRCVSPSNTTNDCCGIDGTKYCESRNQCIYNHQNCTVCPQGTFFCEANEICVHNTTECCKPCKNGKCVSPSSFPEACCTEGQFYCYNTNECLQKGDACVATHNCPTEYPIHCPNTTHCVTNYTFCQHLTSTCPSELPWCGSSSKCESPESCCPDITPIKCVNQSNVWTCVSNSTQCGPCILCPDNRCIPGSDASNCCGRDKFYCQQTNQCAHDHWECPCPSESPIRCLLNGQCVSNVTMCGLPCTMCPNNPTNLCVPDQVFPLNCCFNDEKWCDIKNSCIPARSSCSCPYNATVFCKDEGVCVSSAQQCRSPCGLCSDHSTCAKDIPNDCCPSGHFWCPNKNKCFVSSHDPFMDCTCPEHAPIRCASSKRCVSKPKECEPCSLCPNRNYICADNMDDCCPGLMRWCNSTQMCVFVDEPCCLFDETRCPDARCMANATQCDHTCEPCPNNPRVCRGQNQPPSVCCDSSIGGSTFYCETTKQCVASMNDCPCPSNMKYRCLGNLSGNKYY